jgi:hypothetical protein
MEAIKVDPTDPIPPRNLSAAYYELGVYTKCISTSQEAIALLGSDLSPQNQSHLEKLQARILKAEIHSSKSTAAEKREARKRILAELPRYKPSMFTTTEYFTVGHDVATSIFEADHFEAFAKEAKEVSFFLGGVGDARTVLQTVTIISEAERLKGSPKRRYHFTVNDISKSAVARDIVVWMLLEKVVGSGNEDEKESALNAVFFVYLSTMMPRYAFKMLEETILKAIGSLEKGSSPLEWLVLVEKDIPFYLAALKHWIGEGKEIFTSSEIIDKVSMKMWGTNMQNVGTRYHTEKSLYLEAAVLFPSQKVLELHDPDFLTLMKQRPKNPKDREAIEAFKKHIGEHWHFNITLTDKEWYADLRGKEMFDVGFDPFESVNNHFPYDEVSNKPRNPDRLFEHMKPFFLDAAKAIGYLGDRLKVEAILGDYVDVAEKIEFGLFDTSTRPKEFPILYDRIHLSNVPYVLAHYSSIVAMLIRKQ